MCGLAATFHYSGQQSVKRSSLVSMRDDCMTARGPDAEGLWTDEARTVGLAHRRLSIIDLSERGTQPISHETTAGRASSDVGSMEKYVLRYAALDFDATYVTLC